MFELCRELAAARAAARRRDGFFEVVQQRDAPGCDAHQQLFAADVYQNHPLPGAHRQRALHQRVGPRAVEEEEADAGDDEDIPEDEEGIFPDEDDEARYVPKDENSDE